MPAQEHDYGESVDPWQGMPLGDPEARFGRDELCLEGFGPDYLKVNQRIATTRGGILDWGWMIIGKHLDRFKENAKGYTFYTDELTQAEQRDIIKRAIKEMWIKFCEEDTRTFPEWMGMLVIEELDSELKKKLSAIPPPQQEKIARPVMPPPSEDDDFVEKRTKFKNALERELEKFLEQHPQASKQGKRMRRLLEHWLYYGGSETAAEIAKFLKISKGSVTGGKLPLMKVANRIWRICHGKTWGKSNP